MFELVYSYVDLIWLCFVLLCKDINFWLFCFFLGMLGFGDDVVGIDLIEKEYNFYMRKIV